MIRKEGARRLKLGVSLTRVGWPRTKGNGEVAHPFEQVAEGPPAADVGLVDNGGGHRDPVGLRLLGRGRHGVLHDQRRLALDLEVARLRRARSHGQEKQQQ